MAFDFCSNNNLHVERFSTAETISRNTAAIFFMKQIQSYQLLEMEALYSTLDLLLDCRCNIARFSKNVCWMKKSLVSEDMSVHGDCCVLSTFFQFLGG